MIAPTSDVRAETYFRDGNQCASCGTHALLTFQHRGAVGMGGSKIMPLVVEGLTLCLECNDRTERDLQTKALLHGWKVRRWVQQQGRCQDVPVFYAHLGVWFRLDDLERIRITEADALAMMYAVYGREEYEKWGLVA